MLAFILAPHTESSTDSSRPLPRKSNRQTRLEVRATIERQRAILNAPAPTPQTIQAMELDLVLLEKSIKDNSALAIELKKLNELAAARRTEADAEKKKTDTLQLEIARSRWPSRPRWSASPTAAKSPRAPTSTTATSAANRHTSST